MPRWADIHLRLTEPATTLKDLVAQSEIDDGQITYAGPPIGFAAMTITHSNYNTGEAMSITLGTLEAPRPVFAVLCFAPGCLICRPCLECYANTRNAPGEPGEPAVFADILIGLVRKFKDHAGRLHFAKGPLRRRGVSGTIGDAMATRSPHE
ncbi:hypothetical protein LTR01_006085 [Friedmanniomyces endolithicus]|nr:hypothetical protein LTR01_006085 [Friedmanniomyces endolithicus]KAK0825519.1 hypothetical protein LTR73_007066 [Friedmanniomyces endolithicus]